MLTTANADYDRKFRLWRQHGMSVTDTVRHGSREVIFESYPELGFNYRMTDLQAAIGREQLKRLPEIIVATPATRRAILGPAWPHSRAWNAGRTGLGAQQLAELLRAAACIGRPAIGDAGAARPGISTRRGVMNIHLEQAYAEQGLSRRASSLDRSVAAQDRTIILPLFAQMSEADVAFVADTLADVLRVA